MKRLSIISLFVLCVLASCQSAINPTAQWYNARATLTASQNIIIIGHQNGIIGDDTMIELNPLALAAQDTLAKSKEYLPDGGTEFDTLMNYADSLLVKLQAEEIK